MGDERELPAWRVLLSGSRAVLAVIEREIGQQGAAAISKRKFVARGIGPGQITASVRRLAQLGFVELERGSFGSRPTGNLFRLSERWRELGDDEARKLVRVPRKSRAKQSQTQAEAAAKQPAPRRHYGDDSLARRLREGERAR
jgi:hypothetical protein